MRWTALSLEITIKTLLLALGLTLTSLGATADDSLVRCVGGIAVDPVAGIVSNAPAPNVVRGIPPGGFPWVIKRLRADVKADGRVQVDVREWHRSSTTARPDTSRR
jgi:hypothetical protein